MFYIKVTGIATAASVRFRIGSAERLFGGIVDDTVRFFQVQRDGANTVPIMKRAPSHLADRKAFIYDWPVFKGEGGDEIAAPLTKIGGPVDVEGGWFDAGDFVKFTHASSYSLSEMLYTQRTLERSNALLAAETRHGLEWLDKVWDEKAKFSTPRSGSAPAARSSGSSATTMSGDCRRPTTS